MGKIILRFCLISFAISVATASQYLLRSAAPKIQIKSAADGTEQVAAPIYNQETKEYWEHYIDTYREQDNVSESERLKDNIFGYETATHCIYDLQLNYIWGSPDGVWKRMIAYNGQFPGPTLYCTKGKTMVVRVTNEIEDDNEPTSVHWHGIQQTLTPFYDGPQAVAQCPVLPSTSMIYKFPVYQAGTYWYHSHHTYQYADGNWGFLIIKNTPTEVWQNAYDDERLIGINDWYHKPASELAEEYIHKNDFPWVNSSLINGRGTFNCSLKDEDEICDPNLQGPAIVEVVKGKRYRFRVLNAAASNAYNFTIDNHRMVVIETDGVDTEKSPKFDVLYIIPGQRYSVIVIMDQPVGEYWMRVMTEPPTLGGPPGHAILRVVANPDDPQEIFEPTEHVIGATQGRSSKHNVPWDSIKKTGGIKVPKSDELQKFFPKKPMEIDLQLQAQLDDEHAKLVAETPTPTTTPIDPVTAVMFDENQAPPLKIGPEGDNAPARYDRVVTFEITDCPTTEFPARLCMNENRSWVARNITTMPVFNAVVKGHPIQLDQVPIVTPNYQEVVRIIINNHHPFSHPWHLHGHTVWVLGAGETDSGPYNATRDEPTLRLDGVRRDTVRTKENSWAVISYITDNPGVWFFHCHIAWHLEAGLGANFIECASIARRIYHVAPMPSKEVCKRVGVRI